MSREVSVQFDSFMWSCKFYAAATQDEILSLENLTSWSWVFSKMPLIHVVQRCPCEISFAQIGELQKPPRNVFSLDVTNTCALGIKKSLQFWRKIILKRWNDYSLRAGLANWRTETEICSVVNVKRSVTVMTVFC